MKPESVRRCFGLIFLLLLSGFALSCAEKSKVTTTMTETPHYKIYDNVIADHFTTWEKTDIFIPEGAMVVVMAEGTIYDQTESSFFHWEPWQGLNYKIGMEGVKRHVFSCGDNERPCNTGSSYSGKGRLFLPLNLAGN